MFQSLRVYKIGAPKSCDSEFDENMMNRQRSLGWSDEQGSIVDVRQCTALVMRTIRTCRWTFLQQTKTNTAVQTEAILEKLSKREEGRERGRRARNGLGHGQQHPHLQKN